MMMMIGTIKIISAWYGATHQSQGGGAKICQEYFQRFKIIVGKFCSRSFYNKIKKKFKDLINCQVVYGAKDNHNNYLWSDIIICSDGTSKYEALATGRYALVIKTNKSNDIYGKDFEKLGLFHFIKRNNKDLKENALAFLKVSNNKNLKSLTKHVNNFKNIYFKMSMNNYYKLIRKIFKYIKNLSDYNIYLNQIITL